MERPQRVPVTEWIIAIAAAIGILVAVGQGIILYQQTQILKMERQDALDSGQITEAIAMYTGEYAASMKANVAQAKASLTEATTNNRKSLEQSQKALNRTIELSRSDQRAYVGITGIEDAHLKEGQPVATNIVLANEGKTTALAVRCRGDTELVIRGKRPKKINRSRGKFVSVIDLLPGTSMTGYGLSDPITPEDVQALRDESKDLILFGEITYSDIFGRGYPPTKFTAVYKPRAEPRAGEWILIRVYQQKSHKQAK